MKNIFAFLLPFLCASALAAPSPIIWGAPYPLNLGKGLKFSLSDSSTACNAASNGSIRYNSPNFEGCDGTSWSTLGGGGGSGTVTSVAMTVPSFLSVSGSPVTTSGTLAVTLNGFTTGSVPFVTGGNTFSQDNSNFFWDNTNKRLGLGTSTPQHALDIVVPAPGGSGMELTSTSGIFFYAMSNSTGRLKMGSQGSVGYVGTETNDNLEIQSNNITRMKVLASGNIGINNGSPGSPLTVGGVVESTSGGFKFPDATTQTTAAVPAGASTAIQFNNAGVFGGDAAKLSYKSSIGTTFIGPQAPGGNFLETWGLVISSAIPMAFTSGYTSGDAGILFQVQNPTAAFSNFQGVDGVGSVKGISLQSSGGNVVFPNASTTVGIRTSSPGSPLTVAGTIESTSGGIKFPDATTQTTAAAPMTNWASCTLPFTGSGGATNMTITGQCRRVGDSLDMKILVSFSGAPTFTRMQIGVPSGLTINTTKILDTVSMVVGQVVILDFGIADYSGQARYNSTTDIIVSVDKAYDSGVGALTTQYATQVDVTNAVPFSFGASDTIDVLVTGLPIDQYAF